MYSPCITIQERDTQHLLVGLGPSRVRTPTKILCRVLSLALGKEGLYRVLGSWHSAKKLQKKKEK
jgi:hypothetical protein